MQAICLRQHCIQHHQSHIQGQGKFVHVHRQSEHSAMVNSCQSSNVIRSDVNHNHGGSDCLDIMS